MKNRRFLRPIVLSCLVAFGWVTLPAGASAQTEQSDEKPHGNEAERFRKYVVDEWRWRPRYGVSLTTTEYARNYIEERYVAEDGAFPVRPSGMAHLIPASQRDGPLTCVLFQTKHLDLIAVENPYKDSARDRILFVIIRRIDGEILLDNIMAQSSHLSQKLLFIDPDSKPPFEIASVASFGQTGFLTASLEVFRLRRSLSTLLKVRSITDYNSCPRVQTIFSAKRALQRIIESGGLAEIIELEMRVGLSFAITSTGCSRPEQHQIELTRRCHYVDEVGLYNCKDSVSKPHSIDLDEIPESLNPEESVENFHFLNQRADELRFLGFTFPPEVLDKVNERLTEHRESTVSD